MITFQLYGSTEQRTLGESAVLELPESRHGIGRISHLGDQAVALDAHVNRVLTTQEAADKSLQQRPPSMSAAMQAVFDGGDQRAVAAAR
jgi:hypothetical protein